MWMPLTAQTDSKEKKSKSLNNMQSKHDLKHCKDICFFHLFFKCQSKASVYDQVVYISCSLYFILWKIKSLYYCHKPPIKFPGILSKQTRTQTVVDSTCSTRAACVKKATVENWNTLTLQRTDDISTEIWAPISLLSCFSYLQKHKNLVKWGHFLICLWRSIFMLGKLQSFKGTESFSTIIACSVKVHRLGVQSLEDPRQLCSNGPIAKTGQDRLLSQRQALILHCSKLSKQESTLT